MTLADLLPGHGGIILTVQSEGLLRQRLEDLGFLPGTPIQAQFRAGSGDPTAYQIRGSLLALRRSTATHITIQPLGRSLS
ncbi:MAG: ferrous iron transport protein A [Firmicutes bacterium]|nr:ferrous iron transport protein A [Bacillota bacterium]